MFRTPESKAWTVVLSGFCIFCTLLVSIPLAIRSHIVNATTAQETILEDPIDGVVYVDGPVLSGELVRVEITGAEAYDLTARVAPTV